MRPTIKTTNLDTPATEHAWDMLGCRIGRDKNMQFVATIIWLNVFALTKFDRIYRLTSEILSSYFKLYQIELLPFLYLSVMNAQLSLL